MTYLLDDLPIHDNVELRGESELLEKQVEAVQSERVLVSEELEIRAIEARSIPDDYATLAAISVLEHFERVY
jgi:hypothetical protein